MTQQNIAISYLKNTSIDTKTLTDLYDSVGWSAYTDEPDNMNRLLEGSAFYISAWKDDCLVGLIRAVSDTVSIVYIQDILVHPDYQRIGIGRQLMTSLLSEYQTIRQIVLLTDDTENTKAFYRSLGFSSSDEVKTLAFLKINSKR